LQEITDLDVPTFLPTCCAHTGMDGRIGALTNCLGEARRRRDIKGKFKELQADLAAMTRNA